MGGNEIRGKDLGMCLDDLSPGRVQPYARLAFPLERYEDGHTALQSWAVNQLKRKLIAL